jgi:hypothetical protein
VRLERPPIGTKPVPPLLAQSICYGITAWNPRGVERSRAENDRANVLLEAALTPLLGRADAPATHVLSSYSVSPAGDWREDGFVVCFAAPPRARSKAERLRREDAVHALDLRVLTIARTFGQAAVYKFWNQQFGVREDDHSVLMQTVLPTASVWAPVRSDTVVWAVDAGT